MPKKQSGLLNILLLSSIYLALVSCAGTTSVTPSIVGTWVSEKIRLTSTHDGVLEFEGEDDTDEFVIRFDADKTGNFISENLTFKYEDNGSIKLIFDQLDDQGQLEIMTAEGLAEDRLVLTHDKTTVDNGETFRKLRLITFHRQK